MNHHYDYIIAGAGCAGLSLACRLITCGKFNNKRILLADKSPKTQNDRTWCFWETGEGYFEEIVFRKWDQLWFHGTGFSRLFATAPYEYKMIRGIDFYEYCYKILARAANVEIKYGEIVSIESTATHATINFNNEPITGEVIFSSLPPQYAKKGKKTHHLLQHFKGWVIETESDVFNPGEATLMDFRVPQQHGTSFVYIMPFSANTALIEFTLFTGELLKEKEYDEALAEYISANLPATGFTVKEEEYGIIPMTNERVTRAAGRVIHIGGSGGLTKPSTGYTFQFIQKDSKRLIQALLAGKPAEISPPENRRFHFYDSVLLNVLATNKYPGDKLFTAMFRNNKLPSIFSFLDNESSLKDDLRLISTLPFFPFLKAGVAESVKTF